MTNDPRSYERALERHNDPSRSSPIVHNDMPGFFRRIRDEVEVMRLEEADDVVALISAPEEQ